MLEWLFGSGKGNGFLEDGLGVAFSAMVLTGIIGCGGGISLRVCVGFGSVYEFFFRGCDVELWNGDLFRG